MREKRGGPGPPVICNFLAFSLRGGVKRQATSFHSFVLSLYLFSGVGEKEIGRPTRIDHFDLGQDTVM